MNVRLINFQGLVDLDPSVIEQLYIYLQERETELAHKILDSIHPIPTEAFYPLLPLIEPLKLTEAVEGFTKKSRSIVSGKITPVSEHNEEGLLHDLNQSLWDYAEVLEGGVVELYEQMHQVSVDRWHISLKEVVLSIKNLLLHNIEDLIWAIKRLEPPLKSYCEMHHKKVGWRSLIPFPHKYIDPDLLKNLRQSEDYLKKNDSLFQSRYRNFEKLNEKVEKKLVEMKSYPVLALLDLPVQNLYVDVFRLLKMIEINGYPQGDFTNDIIRSLKHISSSDGIIKIFQTYYHELEQSLYKSSHELKSFDKNSDSFKDQIEKLKIKIQNFKTEIRDLTKTMAGYRDFLLKTDPNPYVSSRWGFAEWVVGPEPHRAKKMLSLVYSGTELHSAFDKFSRELDLKSDEQHLRELSVHQDIEKVLHEMGQPLISRAIMKRRAERLIARINECNEISIPNPEIIKYVGDVLSKGMREDWKYHVLHEFPEFHKIVRQHKGLVGAIKDPSHAFRIDRFLQLFEQINQWTQKGNLSTHAYEIELDMNDMKTYLQDFLASVQRAEKERAHNPFIDDTVDKFKVQLLELRYLFGQFFYLLMNKNSESQQLRNQFLFVDQYFETVENHLSHLSASCHR